MTWGVQQGDPPAGTLPGGGQQRPCPQCAGSRSQEGSQAGRGQTLLHSDPLSHSLVRVILTLSIRFFKRALFLIIH